jgi:hypothetical protein
MATLLLISGLTVTAIATWRGYANARAALGSASDEGDPTRAAIEAARPLLARTRVRRFVRSVAISLGWLVLAMYGLFLASSAELAR